MVKNKSISLRWEMNSILMQIQQKNFFCFDHQHGRLVTWLQTKNCCVLKKSVKTNYGLLSLSKIHVNLLLGVIGAFLCAKKNN